MTPNEVYAKPALYVDEDGSRYGYRVLTPLFNLEPDFNKDVFGEPIFRQQNRLKILVHEEPDLKYDPYFAALVSLWFDKRPFAIAHKWGACDEQGLDLYVTGPGTFHVARLFCLSLLPSYIHEAWVTPDADKDIPQLGKFDPTLMKEATNG